MAVKTSAGLVAYAKAQLGKPYWYGTFGQTATETLYGQKKQTYPQYYTAADFKTQFGQRVHDCIGLIKGYLWSDSVSSTPKYSSSQDVGANGMLARCTEKGGIDTIPEIPGVLVFMTNHVGVYIGGGYVIEAKGHAYGVVKTKLSGRGWTSWGKCPWITYPAEIKSDTEDYEMRTFKNTSGKTLNVYADSSLSIKIGSLPTGNSCKCIDEVDGKAVLRYKVVATGNYKVGFTDYVKGVQAS